MKRKPQISLPMKKTGIVVDAPDLGGGEAILKVHSKNKGLAPEVDLRHVAAATAVLRSPTC